MNRILSSRCVAPSFTEWNTILIVNNTKINWKNIKYVIKNSISFGPPHDAHPLLPPRLPTSTDSPLANARTASTKYWLQDWDSNSRFTKTKRYQIICFSCKDWRNWNGTNITTRVRRMYLWFKCHLDISCRAFQVGGSLQLFKFRTALTNKFIASLASCQSPKSYHFKICSASTIR